MKNQYRSGRNILHIFLLLLVYSSVIILTGCNNQPTEEKITRQSSSDSIQVGGLFRINMAAEFRSIFPHNLVDASAINLMNQVYEGLLRLDPVTKKIVPGLAESYTVSEDGLVYTFNLRKGVYFHDDPAFKDGKGREMRAEDVVYCFTRLCEPSPRNQNFAFVIDLIKGARAHYESGKIENFDGIKELSDYVVQVKLVYPSPVFESILTHSCCWIFPRELYSYEDDIDVWSIGTGPFSARSIKMNEVIILERNKTYWRKDSNGVRLPYLDAVRCNFIENENRQISQMQKGNLDLVMEVPYLKVAELKSDMEASSKQADFEIIIIPRLRVEYYGFQLKNKLFRDANVRKALNYAIDRELLVDSILKGYGEPAENGFIPTAMPGYENDSVKGYNYNPELARKLLAEAGYENGDNFPVLTLQVNDGNSTLIAVADAVQLMFTQVLNITVEIAVLPRNMHYNEVENGNVLFWRDGWIGDYADPENFLRLFYGKLVPEDSVKASFLNTVRFKNAEFDKYFEAALRERDEKLRYEDYVQADQILMDHAVVAPLYYEKSIWLVDKKVQNLDFSGIGLLDLSTTYFDATNTQSRAQPIK